MASVGGRTKQGSQWPEWMKPGIRVLRGPDFLGTVKNLDVANLGTLSYVPHQAGDNKVHVVWDTGLERKYKSGFNGQYELRAYDIQQVGILHKDNRCKNCGMKPIKGVRFHNPATGVDLCTACYMADKDDVNKAFVRYDTPKDDHVTLPTRKECKKLKLAGVFEKSKVIRGPHWGYPSKDGSALEEGTVMSFIPDKEGAINGWVRVKWDIGNDVGEYRFGAGGFVEVVASKVVEGAMAYAEHLPLVGILNLKLGDKVSVNLILADFKKEQTDSSVPGGWKDEMKQCINEVGTIIEFLANSGFARVQYINSNTHIITKSALWRSNGFKEGGAVLILKDAKKLEALQKGHGPFQSSYCGKYGRVVSLMPDGDLKVFVGNTKVQMNPTACEPIDDQKAAKNVPQIPSDESDDDGDDTPCVDGRKRVHDEQEALSDMIGSVYSKAKTIPLDQNDIEAKAKEMHQALLKADIKTVEQLLKKHKELLKYTNAGKNIIHLVSYEGYKGLLSTIIDLGGDVTMADEEGDTPLHYAAFEKRTDCLQMLLQNGADVDAQNKGGTTALMIAVNLPCVDSVQRLIHNNADVSLKDSNGDTAMHEAIEQPEGQPALCTAVLGAKSADYSIRNEKGFNVLQWAVYKDNIGAVDIILRKGSQVIEEKFSLEGFTALHVAAANDFVEVMSLLLGLGNAKPDSRDRNSRTPLHLAVINGRKRAIEVLIEKKADVNAADRDGDTPLHLSQKKHEDPDMLKTTGKRVSKNSEELNIQITYFLLEKGADITRTNREGRTPMDYVEDPKLKDILERVTAAYKEAPAKSQKGVRLPIHWRPMAVTECEMIALDLNDPAQKAEHDDVAKPFMETMEGCTIYRIVRVQNPLLWEHYSLKKREMEFKCGQGCANELHLYHGTRPDLVHVIAEQNFDFRIAGSNVGTLYGEGSYFASTAKYSDLYAHQNDQGYKSMFVAQVLAGKTAQGKPGLKRPPEVDATNIKKGLYDSCVDNVLRPKIYCVFDVNQYYPEYVIEYN